MGDPQMQINLSGPSCDLLPCQPSAKPARRWGFLVQPCHQHHQQTFINPGQVDGIFCNVRYFTQIPADIATQFFKHDLPGSMRYLSPNLAFPFQRGSGLVNLLWDWSAIQSRHLNTKLLFKSQKDTEAVNAKKSCRSWWSPLKITKIHDLCFVIFICCCCCLWSQPKKNIV